MRNQDGIPYSKTSGTSDIGTSGKTVEDKITPKIVILSHDTTKNIRIAANQKSVTLKGRVIDAGGIAEILVNKENVSFDEKGNFAKTIKLESIKNLIIITATDRNGNTASRSVPIKREVKHLAKTTGSDVIKFDSYYALIIGNNTYKHIRGLETPKNDALTVNNILKSQYGFKTRLLLDASRQDIVQAINSYRKTLKAEDSILIYYAGHGEFDGTTGKAYWLPVDAESDDDTNWILSDRITSNLKRIHARHILVISDSCYSGTLTRRAVTDISDNPERNRYLKLMKNRKSRTLMASGGNEPVADTGLAGHSVFAAALISALKDMEFDRFTAEELFYGSIKERVAGNSDQIPEYNITRNSGHDGGDFIFVKHR